MELKKIFFALLIIGNIIAASSATNIVYMKVYVIYSYKYNEKIIEKIFVKKENAQKYCEVYKDSHNYTFEELSLLE